MQSVIAADQLFALSAVLLTLVAVGFWLETTAIGQKLSGALIIIVLAMLLANLKLIPHAAPLYNSISSLLVPLAIPMLLFRADLKRVFQEIGPMLRAFVASVLAITMALVSLALVFDFGEFEAQVTGTLLASYIGGSVNYVATAQAVELTDPTHYTGALAADAIGAVFFLAALLVMPAIQLARRAMPSRYLHDDLDAQQVAITEAEESTASDFDLIGLAAALAVSMVLCALAQWLCSALGADNLFIMVLTVLALLVANFLKPLVNRFHSEFEIGTFFMYLFFAVIGAGADLTTVAGVALPYVIMICAAVVLFFPIILLLGAWLKLDLAELMIAANACILGPATAAAMAAGKGWKDLVTPGMLTGVLGYSIATFVGVGVSQMLE